MIIINLTEYSQITRDDFKDLLKSDEISDDKIQELCRKIDLQVREALNRSIYVMFEDKENKHALFKFVGNKTYTQGYCGAICVVLENKEVTINFKSRFDSNTNMFFLIYLLEKTFGIHAKVYEEMILNSDSENTSDYFLYVMYFYFLKLSMKKGFYKQYQSFAYNDSNIKGRIDLNRHIKENIVLGACSGNISYETCEYTINNDINKLILKAYLGLFRKYPSTVRRYLNDNEEVRKYISLLENEVTDVNTIPEYELLKRTNKKIKHNIYKSYERLRVVSIIILKNLGVNIFHSSIYEASGILFYMPGMWEVFLHNEVFSRIQNTENNNYKQVEYPILVDDNNQSKRTIKPDFIIKTKSGFVIDAKYKKNWNNTYLNDEWEDTREDTFQVFSYMYLLQCNRGGVIFPLKLNDTTEILKVKKYALGQKLTETKECFYILPYGIKHHDTYEKFKTDMELSREYIIEQIEQILEGKI